MATYPLIKDFTDDTDENGSAFSVNPAWVICIVPFKYPVTWSRAAKASNSDIDDSAVADTKNKIIITSDCVQLTTSFDKSSYISSMSATLIPGAKDYIAEVQPGDWIFAWIVNSETDAQSIVSRLKKDTLKDNSHGESCNNFNDGLKFVGRVYSVRENFNVDRGSGKLSRRIAIQGNGFREFDSTVFYDPALGQNNQNIATSIGRIGGNISDFIINGATDTNKIVPTLLELFFGKGFASSYLNPGGGKDLRIGAGSEAGAPGSAAPYAYLVPQAVGDILGKSSRSSKGGILAFADLLELVIGVQNFSSSSKTNDPATYFQPDGIDASTSSHKFTGNPLLGQYVPQVAQFTNRPVWTVLYSYLNDAVNEMFACLRVNSQGKVVPQLIVRQLPYSTGLSQLADNQVTKFLDVPRWKVHPALVFQADIGRSDATRFNFVHVYGQAVTLQKNDSISTQIALSPPRVDTQDIKINGVRMFSKTVACSDKDIKKNGPRAWMDILSDFTMGNHLTLNGSLTMIGIQAPICIGDNLEWNGTVYHIEGVQHTAGIMGSSRTFMTTLKLVHGVSIAAATKDFEIYRGVNKPDDIVPNIGTSYEGQDE